MIRAHLAAHVEAYGGVHPVWVHTGREHAPALRPLRRQPLVPGRAVHVQARELAAARTAPDEHTRPDWVDAPGVVYVEHDGAAELLPGITLVPTPGHSKRTVLALGVETWLAHVERPHVPRRN